MDKPLLIDGLREFLRAKAKSEPVTCKTAIVRQLLKDIDALTDAGHTYVQIAEWLKPQGLDVTGKHLAVMVSQIRRRKKGAKPTAQASLFEARKKFTHSPTDKGDNLI